MKPKPKPPIDQDSDKDTAKDGLKSLQPFKSLERKCEGSMKNYSKKITFFCLFYLTVLIFIQLKL